MESNQLITMIAELCLAVVFLRALWGYLRSRDPVQRDVTAMFAAAAALFVLDLVRLLGQPVPRAVWLGALALLLLQPYLTLRLARRLHDVPRWLTRTTVAAYLVAAIPALVAPQPLAGGLAAGFIAVFIVTECVAAGYLAAEARRRTGAAAIRLRLSAWATGCFAAAGAALGASAVAGANVATAARLLALAAALGYLVAFLPPAWLRRQWSAAAAYTVADRILSAPATETGARIWQRYADTVRQVAGSDAVVVLLRHDDRLDQAAGAGAGLPPPPDCAGAELDTLLARRRFAQPLGSDHHPVAAHYGRRLPGRHLTAVPLTVPPDTDGALLVLDRHRALFRDDDLRMLADLGGQAGILAERGEVIAERGRLADELAQSVEALTVASRAKSNFLASMSHELRTPLNAIIGFSDLMRGEQADGDHRRVPADWVDHIHSSGRHLLGLINDVLDLAKVEAGRLDLQPVPLRVDTAAADLLTALRPLVDGKELEATNELPPLTAHVDPVRYRQMLENLLSNAIKFTPPGGRITLTGGATGPQVTVSVTDTGIGIAPADHHTVFEEFRQVGDPTQRQAGTGLGLALTRRLAQAHGGDIRVRSAPGRGSQFTLYLPAAVPTAPERSETRPGAPPLGRVLVIEDDLRAAELVRTYLTAAGYDIRLASSGEAGLQLAREIPPDAVLLDVQLPGMNGWEVLRQFTNDPVLASVPVLVVTVLDERRTGVAMGAAEYFVKPVDHTALLTALARHVPGPETTATWPVNDTAALRPRRRDHVSVDHQGRISSTGRATAGGEPGTAPTRPIVVPHDSPGGAS
ncbi:MAG TPA: ATP-binding protein [Pilimelia sp.]|nr:ATP-binding protein [Pilimelia sp.]